MLESNKAMLQITSLYNFISLKKCVMLFSLSTSALTPNNLRMSGSQNKFFGLDFDFYLQSDAGIEPGMAG